jgi:hypothetical protein
MKRFMLTLCAAVAIVLGNTTAGRAQDLKGIELARGAGDELKKVFADPNFWAEAVIREAWIKSLPDLNLAIQAALPSINPQLPTKVNITHQESRLSQDVHATVRLVGNSIHLKLTAVRNVLFFKTTTPGPLGSWADPKFSLDYDLDLEVAITLPTRTGILEVGPTVATMRNVKWDSQNFSADLVKIADTVYKFFTHKDFMAKLLKDRQMKFPGLDVKLYPLDRELTRAKQMGFFDLAHSFDPKTKTLKLAATQPKKLGKAKPTGPSGKLDATKLRVPANPA